MLEEVTIRRPLASGRREDCGECEATGESEYGLPCFWCSGRGVRLVYDFIGEDYVSATLSKIARG